MMGCKGSGESGPEWSGYYGKTGCLPEKETEQIRDVLSNHRSCYDADCRGY